MDRAEAEALCHRQQDRRKDQRRRENVDQTADDQQEDVDHEQQQEMVVRDADQERGQRLRDLLHGDERGEGRREGQHEGRDRVQNTGLLQHLDHAPGIELLVNEAADDVGINDRDDRRLRRGKQAGIDTAQNDDRAQQRPFRIPERPQQRTEADEIRLDAVVLLFADEIRDDHQRDAHHDAGQEAGLEHIADRRSGRDGIHDKGNAGRDDDADRSGGRDERGGEALVISVPLHLRDHKAADGRGRRDARAGDRAEEHARGRADQRKAARQEAEDRVRGVQQPLRDAARGHQRARQDKERDRHQRE